MTDLPLSSFADPAALINIIPAGICMVDTTGRYINANTRFCEYIGYSCEELLGLTLDEITHPDDQTRDVNALTQLLAGDIDVYKTEKRYVHKNGNAFWVELTATLVRDAKRIPLYAIGVVHEIESRKCAEAALRESETRFRTLFEQASFSVQLLSIDGHTLQVNKAWEELWHIKDATKSYVLNEYNVLTDPQLEAKGITALIRRAYAGESVALPSIVYDPAEIGLNGRSRWVNAFAHPIKDESGTVREVMLIHNDVTDQVAAEWQLKNAKEAAEAASLMKSEFLANMSHEIRTPLSSILGFAEVLKRDEITADDRKKYLEIIQRNGRSLTQILNDVLDLSQVEAGTTKVHSATVVIQDLVADVVNLFAVEHKKRGLFLNLSIESGAPKSIHTDPVRARQILVNLVGNAIKFTTQGGVTVHVKATEAGSPLEIAVRDTGIGIPPECHDQLFQAFSQIDNSSTRQFAGTGLGLALSKRLAQLLGGDIVLAESVPGGGCTFVLRLPTQTGLPSPQDLPESAKIPSRSLDRKFTGLHVLVADDYSDNQLLLSSLLEYQGATVDVAADGRQAVAKARSGNFDLILMDIQMPVMDGLEAVRELRRLGYAKPIIAITGHAMKEEVRRCLDAGCTDHLPKPIDAGALTKMIDNLALPGTHDPRMSPD